MNMCFSSWGSRKYLMLRRLLVQSLRGQKWSGKTQGHMDLAMPKYGNCTCKMQTLLKNYFLIVNKTEYWTTFFWKYHNSPCFFVIVTTLFWVKLFVHNFCQSTIEYFSESTSSSKMSYVFVCVEYDLEGYLGLSPEDLLLWWGHQHRKGCM